jgi:glucokinase
VFLGVEIGGTKLQAALGDGRGTILRATSVRAEPTAGRAGICSQVEALTARLLHEAGATAERISLAGIGFGGPVRPDEGVVCKSHQVAGWEEFPITRWFEEATGVAAVVGNDSDLAGLAEAHFGAGRGCSRVVYMNIGSGVGGAIVLDGEVYSSQGSGASEIGHMRMVPGEPGAPWATLEDLASGWRLAAAAREEAERRPDSELARLSAIRGGTTTETLVDAVRAGDPAAAAVWDRAVEILGVAVANVVALLRPEAFIVGGGVSLAGEVLFEPLRAQVERQVFPPFRGSYALAPAQLGEEVVLHGALKLARDSSDGAATTRAARCERRLGGRGSRASDPKEQFP